MPVEAQAGTTPKHGNELPGFVALLIVTLVFMYGVLALPVTFFFLTAVLSGLRVYGEIARIEASWLAWAIATLIVLSGIANLIRTYEKNDPWDRAVDNDDNGL